MTARVLIAGYYGAGNAGDEWVLSGLLTALRHLTPGVEARVLSYNPEQTSSEHGVDSFGWGEIETLAETVRWSSLVIVGGGGLWQDYWGFDPLDMLSGRPGGIAGYGTPILLAHLFGRPCAVLGAGVGPVQATGARQAIRDLAAMAGLVSVRDDGSRMELIAYGVPTDRIHVGADLAFLADAPREPVRRACSSRTLTVNLRPWPAAGETEGVEVRIAAALRVWCASHDGRVIFVPLHESNNPLEDDRSVIQRVAAAVGLPDRVEFPEGGLGWPDRLSVLASGDLVLGMRYHAVLAALRAGVPCVALAYDPKVWNLMREAGLEEQVLDPIRCTEAEIRSRLGAASRISEAALEALRTRALTGVERALQLKPETRQSTLAGTVAVGQAAYLTRLEAGVHLLSGLRTSFSPRTEAGTASLRRLADERLGLEAALDRTRQDTEDLRAAVDAEAEQVRMLERELAGTRDALEESRSRAAEAASQLASLRATSGVRLLDHYWRLLRRLAPEGSPARGAYLRARQFLRSAAMVGRGRGACRNTSWDPGPWPAGRVFAVPKDATWWRTVECYLDRRRSDGDEPTVFVLSPTRLEADEGQRSYHLARGLAARNRRVVFGYWRWALGTDDVPKPQTDGVLAIPMDVLLSDPDRAFSLGHAQGGMVVLEFPLPASGRFLAAANGHGYVTVYEAVDDWAAFHQAGQAPWYRASFEGSFAANCDVLVSVCPELADRIHARSGRWAHVVPNGWSPEVPGFAPARSGDRGVMTVGYAGHLSDAWFDWELVLACALKHPAWRFHLVGYGGGWRTSRLPQNVVYHGKLPHSCLASLAAGWDVGIVPFRCGAIAAAADPIKVYEYLALDLPVVSTGIHVPCGAEGLVQNVSGADAFADAVEGSVRTREATRQAREAFASTSTWTARVDALERAVQEDSRARFKRQVFETV